MKIESPAKRAMYKEIKKYWVFGVISCVMLLLMQLVSLIPPLVMKKIIDNYIPNKDLRGTYLSIIIFCLIPVILTLCNALYRYILMLKIKKFSFNIKKNVFKNLLQQPMSFFMQNKSGELAAYCTKDVTEFVYFWLIDIPSIVCNIIMVVTTFIILFNISPKISILQLLYIPVVILPMTFLGKKLKECAKKIMEYNAKSNQVITESFNIVKLIKTSCSEDKMVSKLSGINNKIMKLWGKTVAIENLYGDWSTQFVAAVFLGLSFSFCAVQVINSNFAFTVGSLVAYITYLPKFQDLINQISATNFKLNRQFAEHEKTFEYLALENEYHKEEVVVKGTFDKSVVLEGPIEFNEVNFKYPGTEKSILNNMSFIAEKGKMTFIVGESGAGKSTIFELIMRMYSTDSGTIKINEEDIKQMPLRFLRKNISIVSQNLTLMSGSLRENMLLFNPEAKDRDIILALEKAGLKDFMGKLPEGLDSNLVENAFNLSGGEKQRISIAMALLKKSKILLLDEISSNLDEGNEEKVYETINELVHKEKVTALVITHRYNAIKEDSTVIRIENGQGIRAEAIL